jgi:hypothetical protein
MRDQAAGRVGRGYSGNAAVNTIRIVTREIVVP